MSRAFDLTKMTNEEYGFLVDAGWELDSRVIDSRKLSSEIRFTDAKFWSLPKAPPASLGILDSLPTEIIYLTLEMTPLSAIMCLRSVNSRVKSIIEQWTPFRDIMLAGQTVLKALVATQASNLWTAPQLVNVIYTDRCEICGDLGTLVQLLTLSRCCLRCLSNDRRLHSLPLPVAEDSCGLNINKKDVKRIPRLFSIPRKTFWGRDVELGSICMLDYTSALQYSRDSRRMATVQNYERSGGEDHQQAFSKDPVPTILRNRLLKNKDRAIYHTLPQLPTSVVFPSSETWELRFLTAIYAPPYRRVSEAGAESVQSPKSVIHQQSHSCRGCRYFWNLHSRQTSSLCGHWTEHKLYTKPEIDQHLKTCIYARIIWDYQLYPNSPTGARIDHVRTIQILNTANHAYFPRMAGSTSPERDFEMVPSSFRWYWLWNPQEGGGMSGYGDDLIEESQSMWCTARAGNDWLTRHAAVMYARKRRVDPRNKQLWGLDRF